MKRPRGLLTWGDAYGATTQARRWTAIYQGGPADGQETELAAGPPPPVRYFALAGERGTRAVTLHRYTLQQGTGGRRLLYSYSGTEWRQGPVPGLRGQPAWS